jgi:hypothetical protein
VVTPWDVAGGSDGKIDYNKLIRDVRALCICIAYHLINGLSVCGLMNKSYLNLCVPQFGVSAIDAALIAR